MQKNAADPNQIKKQAERVKNIDRRNRDDVKFLLSTVQGRRFLWRYLGRCGVFKTSFTGNSETFFKEGHRNVGLWILNDIMEASPDAYLKMMKENRDETDNDDSPNDRDTGTNSNTNGAG